MCLNLKSFKAKTLNKQVLHLYNSRQKAKEKEEMQISHITASILCPNF